MLSSWSGDVFCVDEGCDLKFVGKLVIFDACVVHRCVCHGEVFRVIYYFSLGWCNFKIRL